MWVILGSASCQNSPCFQCEDTIEVVLALWPRNSWLSVSLNTRVTLLMGWWKPSWCQCWIHLDMFAKDCTCYLMLKLKLCFSPLCRGGWILGYTVFTPHDIKIYGLHLSDRQSGQLPYLPLLINILCLVLLTVHRVDLLFFFFSFFCACVCSLHCTNTSQRLPGHCFPSLDGFPLVMVC